jgi:tetratricopeptide (TPR) repeat protein
VKTVFRIRSIRFLFITFFLTASVFSSLSAREKEDLVRLDRTVAAGKELYAEYYYMGAIDKWTEALGIAPWNDEIKSLIAKALKRYEEISKKVEEAYDLLESKDVDGAYTLFLYARENSSHRNEALYDLIVRGIHACEEEKNRIRFQKIIDRGDAYLQASRFDAAENLYTFANKFSPSDPRIKERLALVSEKREKEKIKQQVAMLRDKAADLFEQGRYEESKKLWGEVLVYSPGDTDALLYLSKIGYRERERERLNDLAKSYFNAGMQLYKAGTYADAIDQFEDAVALEYRVEESKKMIAESIDSIKRAKEAENARNIQLVQGHLREGIKFYNLGKYRESLQSLNRGLLIDPENTQIKEYILRDTIALRQEEERAVAPSSPFYPLVQDLRRLGLDAFAHGEYGESIKRWEEILLIFPFNEEARRQLTMTLAKTDPSLADEILTGLYNEARSLIARDEKREALVKLKLILETNPKFKDADEMLKRLENEQKEKKVIVTQEDRTRAQEAYKKGLEFYRQEKLSEAFDECSRAVQLDPDFVEARVFLASVETKLHNMARLETDTGGESAIKSSEMKIKLKRHYMDGVNLYLDGLYREAISEWEKVLKMDPSYENVQMNIERAKKRLQYEKDQKSS